MSYIIKQNEPLVNLKLTDLGRSNLSSGKLTFTNFSLGDGEMDYDAGTPSLINILRPVDNQHDIQYPVPSEGTNYKLPISLITSYPNEIHSTAKERGFFNVSGTTIDSSLSLIYGATGFTSTGTTTIDLSYTPNSLSNTNYKTTVDAGDLIFIKFKTPAYTTGYTQVDYNEMPIEPIPMLMYSIKYINSVETFNLTGYTSGVTLTFTLDRELPKFAAYDVDAFIYPGGDTIKNYYDEANPIAYWSGGTLDFTMTGTTHINDDVQVWNMNILNIDDVIGLDSLIYRGKYNVKSRNYLGTAINYDYFLDNLLNRVGIIHYTNNSVGNFYGEGFYRNTFQLTIPYLMWHKKQFGGTGLGSDIGYTFISDSTVKHMGVNNSIVYYDLIDSETTPTVIGKVLPNQKIVLIEDPEILAVMSYKANRNWTLPTPKLTVVEPGLCPEASTIGVIQPNESFHATYLLLDTNGVTGLHCESYSTAQNLDTKPKDVVFEFPKNSSDITYSQFSYLKDYNTSTDGGLGFRTNSIIMLWQKTIINAKPDPNNWNYLNVNRFLGTNGCLSNISAFSDNFELFAESSIYPTSFTGYQYTLTKQQVGDVIVSINGLILQEASSALNIGVDGDYYIYPLNVTLTNNSVIEFNPILTQTGYVIQFHYLIGGSTTATTIRSDITIPSTGITTGYTYSDGIYLIGSVTALTLEYQPNNNVVYLFYNGQLISTNNYGVIPTGTTATRRIELGFTPANGSKISILYLDNSGLGGNPTNTSFTGAVIEKLRINLDKTLIDVSADSKYILNNFISVPTVTNIVEPSFGDEVFFYGNINTDIKATIYKSLITCNILPNKFINTSNPTFNPNQDKVSFTEIGIYDEDDDLVAIGKFSEPLVRKYNSDMLIIQATIDF